MYFIPFLHGVHAPDVPRYYLIECTCHRRCIRPPFSPKDLPPSPSDLVVYKLSDGNHSTVSPTPHPPRRQQRPPHNFKNIETNPTPPPQDKREQLPHPNQAISCQKCYLQITGTRPVAAWRELPRPPRITHPPALCIQHSCPGAPISLVDPAEGPMPPTLATPTLYYLRDRRSSHQVIRGLGGNTL